ncbi:FAD-binding oxidoreductase (plasmid) [Novosphingobium sp. THN1]|uniref:FAD-binding oxidoreductase n=1 Tax=Novosphingobium sp. THN1 TaxID=1016987 RepID=UPI000E52F477|nr:FAD-binding oxidoreductase [Novosphingobium sp. THN1]AXU21084.1 FAD-binding oxidoreductase [Novosphingobium sp. THN1]
MADSMTLSRIAPAPAELRTRLEAIVGAEHVTSDEATLRLFSEDIWSRADHCVMLSVAPANTAELAAVVSAANDAGVDIAPRGAGMSYTSSYTPATDSTITLDMRRMDRVLRVSPEDMTVTVEAGCTWLALNEALKPHGLRTPFWGPMSGIWSTIGGGLSQLNAMFGAGHYGTSSESVVAITMVLADGRTLRTGARGPDGDTPHYRHYGPDLAGLFMGDSGTLGIKAEITLRLIRNPAFEDSVSFSFKTGEIMLEALAEMTRAGIASETCGFDPGLTKVRMKRMSMASDVKTLGKVIAKEKSFGKGLLAAAKIAIGGRNFIPEEEYPLHITAEGRCKEAVAADIATAREIAARFEGVEIENSIAKVIRAMPFPAPNSILGPEGESWAPVHGQASLSTAAPMFAEIRAYFDSMKDTFDKHGIHNGFLFSSLSTTALVIEPVFFWPEGYRPIHEAMVEPAHLKNLKQLGPNAEATVVVTEAREHVKAICKKYGAAHFQIGRAYTAYRESRDEAFKDVLDAVKAVVDPRGVFNPGCLGFPIREGRN